MAARLGLSLTTTAPPYTRMSSEDRKLYDFEADELTAYLERLAMAVEQGTKQKTAAILVRMSCSDKTDPEKVDRADRLIACAQSGLDWLTQETHKVDDRLEAMFIEFYGQPMDNVVGAHDGEDDLEGWLQRNGGVGG